MTKNLEEQRLTKNEAVRLSTSLVRQIKHRYPALAAEALWAFGFKAPKTALAPPVWLGNTIRVVFTGNTKLHPQKVAAADLVSGFGASAGMSRMWKAVLVQPPKDVADLETRFPEMVEMRNMIGALCSSAFRTIERADRKLKKASFNPSLQLAYIEGERVGAGSILRPDGTLNDDTSIRGDVCYFLWLYWPQNELLSSISDLEKFFAEMRQDSLSRKHLEKICRDVGLKFKNRGRPKKTYLLRP